MDEVQASKNTPNLQQLSFKMCSSSTIESSGCSISPNVEVPRRHPFLTDLWAIKSFNKTIQDLSSNFRTSQDAAVPQLGMCDKFSASMDNVAMTVESKKKWRRKQQQQQQNALNCNYFTVHFDFIDDRDIELIPAKKGVTLRETLGPPLIQRSSITTDAFEAYLENSKNSIPLHVDASYLGGSIIHIKKRATDGRLGKLRRQTEKRGSSGILQSVGKQPCTLSTSVTGTHLMPSNDCEASGSMTTWLKTPTSRPRRASFSLFSSVTRDSEATEERLDKLKDRLSQFECNGLPESQAMSRELDLQMESHWREVVHEMQDLCKENCLQQAAIWELLQTEVNFIGLLRVLVEVYIPCLKELQQTDGLLDNVEANRLFGNVNEIFLSACTLWMVHLHPCLKKARGSGNLLDLRDFRNGFIHFDEIMQPYAQFTIFRADAKFYHESLVKDDLFAEFVRWAQTFTSSQCEWLTKSADINLESLLSQPWQRLQRYPLILKEIRRYTLDEEELNDVNLMIDAAEQFCSTVDRAVVSKEYEDELKSIGNRLDEIRISDMLDTPSEECQRILQEYVHLDLLRPMVHCQRLRRKLHQIQLRMRDEKNKWTDVICFLFSDMLLLTRASKRGADRLKQLRSPIRLDKLVLRRLLEGGHGAVSANQGGASCLGLVMNDFNGLAAVYIFSGEAKLLDDWIEKISQAQVQFEADFTGYTQLSAEDSLFMTAKHCSTSSISNSSEISAAHMIHRTQSEGPVWEIMHQHASRVIDMHQHSSSSRAFGSSSDGSELELQQSPTAAQSGRPADANLTSSSMRRKERSLVVASQHQHNLNLPAPSISVDASLSDTSAPASPSNEARSPGSLSRSICRTNKLNMTDGVSIHKSLSWNCAAMNNSVDRRSVVSLEGEAHGRVRANTHNSQSGCGFSSFSSVHSRAHSTSEISETSALQLDAHDDFCSSSTTLNECDHSNCENVDEVIEFTCAPRKTQTQNTIVLLHHCTDDVAV